MCIIRFANNCLFSYIINVIFSKPKIFFLLVLLLIYIFFNRTFEFSWSRLFDSLYWWIYLYYEIWLECVDYVFFPDFPFNWIVGLTCAIFKREGVEIPCPDSAAGLYIKTRTDQIVKVYFLVIKISLMQNAVYDGKVVGCLFQNVPSLSLIF